MNLIKEADQFKLNINLQEASTDKIIAANPMCKKPKIIPLKKMFEKLFEENGSTQSIEQQISRLRKLS